MQKMLFEDEWNAQRVVDLLKAHGLRITSRYVRSFSSGYWSGYMYRVTLSSRTHKMTVPFYTGEAVSSVTDLMVLRDLHDVDVDSELSFEEWVENTEYDMDDLHERRALRRSYNTCCRNAERFRQLIDSLDIPDVWLLIAEYIY